MRLTHAQIPIVTVKLLAHQKHLCPLCGLKISASAKAGALDHDHDTGYIRGVLCRNCNGVEGHIRHWAKRAGAHMNYKEYVAKLLAYWQLHTIPQYGGKIHPTHKTAEEKRVARLKRAKAIRDKKKEV